MTLSLSEIIYIIMSYSIFQIFAVMAPGSDAEAIDPTDNVSRLLEEVFEASTQAADLTDLIATVSDLYDAVSYILLYFTKKIR